MRQKLNSLVGTWEQATNPDYATSVHYTIALRGGKVAVSGVDSRDGEKLKISNVRWNGKELRFISLCRSTGWTVKHVFKLLPSGLADHKCEYEESETWRKRRAPIGTGKRARAV